MQHALLQRLALHEENQLASQMRHLCSTIMAVLLPLKHMCHAQELQDTQLGLQQEAEPRAKAAKECKLVS